MQQEPEPLTLVFKEALEKYQQGEAKYGTFHPAKGTRDFLKEAEAEILDAINYLAMFLMKIRKKREKEYKPDGKPHKSS